VLVSKKFAMKEYQEKFEKLVMLISFLNFIFFIILNKIVMLNFDKSIS